MAQFTKEWIQYEDADIIVCQKPAGFPVQSARIGEQDMESALRNYFAGEGGSRSIPYVGIIHRLDQPVEGLLVFAKNTFAAKQLNQQMQKGTIGKYYLAVVTGEADKKEKTGINEAEKNILEDYLLKNGRTNCSQVVKKGTAGAKLAKLEYEIKDRKIMEDDTQAMLVKIHLYTGRHHQIRVQMAHAGMPLWGDTKYNSDFQETGSWSQIALCAYSLNFQHPKTKKVMKFSMDPENPIFGKFDGKYW